MLNIESSNISELARKLNITDKTITADIDHFNVSCFPAHIGINHYKEAFLRIPKNINLDDIYVKILNSSINVKILKHIFIAEPTLNDISTELFLSKTSIRRIVTKINTYFLHEKMDIQIDLDTKLVIVGNETKIRRLFASMFKEMYRVKEFT